MKKKIKNPHLQRFTRKRAYESLEKTIKEYVDTYKSAYSASKWREVEIKLSKLYQDLLIWEKICLFFGKPSAIEEHEELSKLIYIKNKGFKARIDEIKAQHS